jgi:hypothetical protein
MLEDLDRVETREPVERDPDRAAGQTRKSSEPGAHRELPVRVTRYQIGSGWRPPSDVTAAMWSS